MKPIQQTKTGVVIFAVVLVFIGNIVRADAPTPFLDAKNKVGDVTTTEAGLISLGSGDYLVVVVDDTVEYHAIKASAGKGVVKPEHLGHPVTVKAKIVERIERKGPPQIRLEILSVEQAR